MITPSSLVVSAASLGSSVARRSWCEEQQTEIGIQLATVSIVMKTLLAYLLVSLKL